MSKWLFGSKVVWSMLCDDKSVRAVEVLTAIVEETNRPILALSQGHLGLISPPLSPPSCA